MCPKCEEGTIKKILFKKSERVGFLCEFCGTVWFENENINTSSGHVIQSFTSDDREYTFIDVDEEDEDSKSIMYPKFK